MTRTGSAIIRRDQEFARDLTSAKPAAVGPEAGKLAVKIMLLAERSLRERRIMKWIDLPA